MNNRFKYYMNSQMIVDTITGKHYYGNKSICDLLNQINNRADANAEKYFELKKTYDECNARKWIMRKKIENYQNILKKYNIHSLTELDEILNKFL